MNIKRIEKVIREATRKAYDEIGYTGKFYGYLGKGDGTNTMVVTAFKAKRAVYYYTKRGTTQQSYAMAILSDDAPIVYEDSSFNKDRAVRLGFPPGISQDNSWPYVIGIASLETYNATDGNTPQDNRVRNAPGSVLTTGGTPLTLADDQIVNCNAAGGSMALTVTTSAKRIGQQYIIKKVDASANTVTVTPSSGTIDGAANKVLSAQWAVLRIFQDGTNWFTY